MHRDRGRKGTMRRAVLRRSLSFLLTVALALALSACGGTAVGSQALSEAADDRAAQETVRENAEGAESADAEAADVVYAAEMPRVVALSKSLSELWLLAGGELVGATEDAFELDAVSERTQSVGTISKPNREAILALMPDVVMVTTGIPAQKELTESLPQAGIEVLDVRVDSFDDYDAVMRDFTSRTGRSDLYEQNVAQVRERIAAILARVPELPEGEAQTYLTLRVSSAKNTVLKKDNFACAMLDDMGLRNIADDDSALDELSLEAIVAADPDNIFVVLQGDEDKAKESFQAAFAGRPVWSGLSAVQEGRVFILPKEYFQYKPNAAWDEAYQYLYELLWADGKPVVESGRSEG